MSASKIKTYTLTALTPEQRNFLVDAVGGAGIQAAAKRFRGVITEADLNAALDLVEAYLADLDYPGELDTPAERKGFFELQESHAR